MVISLLLINTISKEEFINQKLIGKINKYVAPKNWVVLNISNFSGYYVVNFVLNDGSSLNKSMHDYGAVLSENGNLKNIVVKDNVWWVQFINLVMLLLL